MKKLLIIACLVTFGLTSNSQLWTEPVVINPMQSQLYSDYPDFCIDNAGTIHCVWSTKHNTNFYRIWYSKSEDDGETWSPPYNVSQNNSQWMNEPHIVSDSQGNLHLTYDNISSESDISIIYKFFDGENWSAPDTLSQGFAMRNLITIDHNDRLYCFWYVPMATSGNTFYRVKDYLQPTWSEIKIAYDSLFLRKVVLDSFNNLKIIGLREKVAGSIFTLCYGEYYNENWNDLIEISPETYINSYDLNIDQNSEPHIIWQQNTPPIISNSILYIYRNNNIWSQYDTITSNSDDLAICFDLNNELHIVLSKKEGDFNKYLIHYSINNNWENDTIDIGSFFKTKLLNFCNSLYMINGIVDTVIWAPHTRILFRKCNIINTATKNPYTNQNLDLNVYPNPSTQRFYFTYYLYKPQIIKSDIFTLKGDYVKCLYDGKADVGNINLYWDGTNRNGLRVSKGIYLIRIITRQEIITKKIILN